MKKGFVFIETIVVLVALITGVLSLFATYTLLTADIERKEYYDNISDLYKTDILRSLIDVTKLTGPSGILIINKDNCTSYMNSSCANDMTSLYAENIYVNYDKLEDILGNFSNICNNCPNSMQEYINVIKTNDNTRFIIVNFKYNNQNYYASLKI